MNDRTPFSTEHQQTLAAIVTNFHLLPHEEAAYFAEHKDEVPRGFRSGFTLPGAISLPAVPVGMTGYPMEETDCFLWLGHMERFAAERFDEKVNLREMFPIPARLPWKQILPIFVPAGLTNRQMVERALKAQGLSVGEGTNVEEFTGANGAELSRLFLIERTSKPTLATMGLPPKYAGHWFGGRQTHPLNLCGYGVGTGLLYKVEKAFLDPLGVTASWFPENIYPSSDEVACGCYYPDCRKVWFRRNDAGYGCGCFGFREAILLFPKP